MSRLPVPYLCPVRPERPPRRPSVAIAINNNINVLRARMEGGRPRIKAGRLPRTLPTDGWQMPWRVGAAGNRLPDVRPGGPSAAAKKKQKRTVFSEKEKSGLQKRRVDFTSTTIRGRRKRRDAGEHEAEQFILEEPIIITGAITVGESGRSRARLAGASHYPVDQHGDHGDGQSADPTGTGRDGTGEAEHRSDLREYAAGTGFLALDLVRDREWTAPWANCARRS